MERPTMKVPFKLTVMLPDGQEYPVASLYFDKQGDVTRITTFNIDGKAFGPWYNIEGDELAQVTLWMASYE